MAILAFKPKQTTKRLVSVLPERAQDVITRRYGLGGDSTRMTLESIGGIYGITRERVRQIENAALNLIRKSDVFEKENSAFEELHRHVRSLGGIVAEDDFLQMTSNQPSAQNHMYLLLVLGDPFNKEKENEHFKHRWHVDKDIADKVHDALHKLYKKLSKDDIVSEKDILDMFLENLENIPDDYKKEEVLRRWLAISKAIDSNPLGEWGIANSPNIRVRGMRDYAFLVIRRHGSPMHFTEVAKAISDVFGKSAHTATCHNELIKDDRFVLVGRGLYALSEWGYAKGVVKDIIHKILKQEGPLTKQEIIDRVFKERYVKENTIVVNLQDSKYFNKDTKGRYGAV